jgi:hypothetical protein
MFSAQQFPSAYSTLSGDQMNRMLPGSVSWDPMSRMQNVNPMEQLGMHLMPMSQMNPMPSFQAVPPYQMMQDDDQIARIREIKRMAMDKLACGMNPISRSEMNPLSCGPIMSRVQSCGMNPMSGMQRFNPFGYEQSVQSLMSCNPIFEDLLRSNVDVKLEGNINQPLISFSDPQFPMRYGHLMWN